MMDIKKRLFEKQDTVFRDFQRRLLPTLPPEKIIGVRTSDMRAIARSAVREEEREEFLHALPHEYHEENCVHAFMLEVVRDYDECIAGVEAFLPYIDNWATCDQLSPKVFGERRAALLPKVRGWLKSERAYTIRFGVNMLMKWYLDGDNFSPDHLALVADIRSEEYYVKMVIAWYFATALAKQYDEAVKYIEQKRLDSWTHNKTIQKAVESYRITPEIKEHLKTMKIRAER